MKDSAIIINTARGQIFDLDDLYNALLNNEIRAVGTDVLPDEPPNENHQLIKDWKKIMRAGSQAFNYSPLSIL